MKKPDAYLDSKVLKYLSTSTYEDLYNEVSGTITGRPRYRMIGRTRTRILTIDDAFPQQTAERKKTTVRIGNETAFKRHIHSIRRLGGNIVGGYHSHGKSSYPYPTDYDRDAIKDFMRRCTMDQWIELIAISSDINALLNGVGGQIRTNREGIVVDIRISPYKMNRTQVRGYMFWMDDGELFSTDYHLYTPKETWRLDDEF